MGEINRIIRGLSAEKISLAISVGTSFIVIIAFIIKLALWQQSIDIKVSADDTRLSKQDTILQNISNKVDLIDKRNEVTDQKVNDVSDKINLIYKILK